MKSGDNGATDMTLLGEQILAAPIGAILIARIGDASRQTDTLRVRIDPDINAADRAHGLIRVSVWWTPRGYTHGASAAWVGDWWDLARFIAGDDVDLGTVRSQFVWGAVREPEIETDHGWRHDIWMDGGRMRGYGYDS